MDDDMIFATRAFLAEFDGAASDDEHAAERRRQSSQRQPSPHCAPVVAATITPDAASSRQRAQATVKPKTKAKATAKRSNKPEKAENAIAETVAKTDMTELLVPMAAQPKSRKEELEFLRDQVSELEERLRLLKRTAGRGDDRLTYPPADGSGGTSTVTVTVSGTCKPTRIASMWEDLAMRQYQQRQRAEVDNLKLKSSLEDQLKVAKSLQRMLKRSKCDALTPQNHAKRSRLLLSKSPAEDAAEFDALVVTVTQMYAELDDAFADARFATADVAFRDLIVQQDTATGTTIEVLTAKMLPFDVATTAQAIWDFFINDSMETQDCHVERTLESSENLVMKSINFELQMKRQSGRFVGKIVGRRYQERDRDVIIWAIVAEPVEVSHAPMGSFLIRQRGWSIVRRPATSDIKGVAATIQAKHICTPMLYEDVVPDRTRKLELLIECMVGSLFQQIDASQQVVENELVQGLSRVTLR